MPKIISGIRDIDSFSNRQPKLPQSGGGAIRVRRSKLNIDIIGPEVGLARDGNSIPDTSYTANAVHFDGSTFLRNESLSFSDGNFWSAIWWFKYDPAIYISNTIFVSDPDVQYATFGAVGPVIEVASTDANNDLIIEALPLISTNAWHCMIFCSQTNLASPLNPVKMYIDDVDVTDISEDAAGSGFNTALNGLPFVFGQDGLNPAAVIDFADVRIMSTSLLTGSDISEATRRLFIDANGKPVDPATATASLGTPAILFSGDASTFGTNQGSGGAFTTTGALTNASTSPSD